MRHARELLQAAIRGYVLLLRLAEALRGLGALCGGRGLALVERSGLAVEIRLALRLAVFDRLQLGAALLCGGLELLAHLHHRRARRDVGLLQPGLDLGLGLFVAKAHLLLYRLRLPAAHESAQSVAQQQAKEQQHRDDQNRDAVRKAVPRAAG